MPYLPAPPQSLAASPLAEFGEWFRDKLPVVALLVIGAVLLTRFLTWFSTGITARMDNRSHVTDVLVRSEAIKHRRAVAQVVTWAAVVVVYCVTAVLVLGALDIPLGGFVAPATVAGVALGFGAQRIVQDLLAGFFIVTERQYGFGDVVRLAVIGTTTALGTVEEVTLRVTSIRTLDGEVVTTPNGQIVQVTNLSRDWARAVVDVPVPVTADVNRVSEVLRAVGAAAFADPSLHELLLDEPSVMGVESLAVDQFNVRVVARTLPSRQFEVGRALRARVTEALLHEGITVSPDVGGDERGRPVDA